MFLTKSDFGIFLFRVWNCHDPKPLADWRKIQYLANDIVDITVCLYQILYWVNQRADTVYIVSKIFTWWHHLKSSTLNESTCIFEIRVVNNQSNQNELSHFIYLFIYCLFVKLTIYVKYIELDFTFQIVREWKFWHRVNFQLSSLSYQMS